MTKAAAPQSSEMRRLRAAIRRFPCWTGRIAIAPLAGGLTNRNFVVADARSSFVLRSTGGDLPAHGIDRARELAASRAAHRAGIAPAVVHAAPGYLVFAKIEGRTLAPEAVREIAMLRRVAALLRRAHASVHRHLEGPAAAFWPFHVLRDYLRQLGAAGRLTRRQRRWTPLVAALERDAGPVAVTFTHNDLMPGNLIDDGARLWLIDWEYAGFGAPLFDVAGVAINSELSARMRQHLLAAYLGRAPRRGEIARFSAFRLAASLRESLWGSIQELHSGLDFDYAGYAETHAEAFAAALAEHRRGRFA
jgi:thiamine kinase-like enzyme